MPKHIKASDIDKDVNLTANSDTKIPSQKATKTYVDTSSSALITANRVAGSIGFRAKGLNNFMAAYANRKTTPVDIVVIGDSISIANCIGGESSFPYVLLNDLNSVFYTPFVKNGWRTANGADTGAVVNPGGVPGMLTNAGTDSATGSGAYSKIMSNGQKCTYQATMNGVSIVYSKDPSYGSLEIRDGVGGTLLTTITTTGTAKAGNVWTSSALTKASHTIEVTSVGANKFEAMYVHNEDLTKGVRVWNLGHSGYKTSDFLADPTRYLDFIENMQPDLVIIATGVNDTNSTTYVADVTTLVSNVQGVSSGSDISFWVPYRNANFPDSKLTAIRSYLASTGYPYADASALLYDQDFTTSRWAGFGVHPNGNFANALAINIGLNLTGDSLNNIVKRLAVSPDLQADNNIFFGSLSTKGIASVTNPITSSAGFTGSTLDTTGNITAVGGNISTAGFGTYPILGLKEPGNTYQQLLLAGASYNSFFNGFTGAGFTFGSGTAAADVKLYRDAAGSMKLESKLAVTGGIKPRYNTVASSATPAINTDTTEVFSITALTVDITSMTTNLTGTPLAGQRLHISITGTAARTIAWGASFEASTVALPTTTVTTARLDCEFIWNDATSKWRIMYQA